MRMRWTRTSPYREGNYDDGRTSGAPRLPFATRVALRLCHHAPQLRDSFRHAGTGRGHFVGDTDVASATVRPRVNSAIISCAARRGRTPVSERKVFMHGARASEASGRATFDAPRCSACRRDRSVDRARGSDDEGRGAETPRRQRRARQEADAAAAERQPDVGGVRQPRPGAGDRPRRRLRRMRHHGAARRRRHRRRLAPGVGGHRRPRRGHRRRQRRGRAPRQRARSLLPRLQLLPLRLLPPLRRADRSAAGGRLRQGDGDLPEGRRA